jgi:vacuolar-type H+-ATPase catalytic subunit A/Vma1
MTGHAIHIKLDGRTYSGTYKVDRQILTVKTNFGTKLVTFYRAWRTRPLRRNC